MIRGVEITTCLRIQRLCREDIPSRWDLAGDSLWELDDRPVGGLRQDLLDVGPIYRREAASIRAPCEAQHRIAGGVGFGGGECGWRRRQLRVSSRFRPCGDGLLDGAA